VNEDQIYRAVRRAFVIGYIHGRGALDDYTPSGHEAEAAFEKWFTEVGVIKALNLKPDLDKPDS
jgi:hypothetical protein